MQKSMILVALVLALALAVPTAEAGKEAKGKPDKAHAEKLQKRGAEEREAALDRAEREREAAEERAESVREEAEEAGLVINITREGGLIVSGRTIGLRELEEIVWTEIEREPDRTAQQLKLLIRADRNASAARLNRVVEVLRPLGVGAARLATEVPR